MSDTLIILKVYNIIRLIQSVSKSNIFIRKNKTSYVLIMNFDLQFPLIIDVDGTLIKNDLTFDLLVQCFGKSPLKAFACVKAGLSEKSKMKGLLVGLVGSEVNAAHLPYNQTVIDIAEKHHAQGGKVVLCSGSHQTLIDKIVAKFDWISEGFGTTNDVNLTKENKANFLLEKFGSGFHYIGNSTQDYPVWEVAVTAAAINPPRSVSKIKAKSGEDVVVLEDEKVKIKTILKCIRIHQWAKNGLIGLIPLLTVSSLSVTSVFSVVIGFFAMSFLASATYIFNDLLDLSDDRQHPSKCRRPLASGAISVPRGLSISILLAFGAIACLFFLPATFSYVLLTYFVLTVSYSFFFKRVAIIDVIMLAGLFTIRVIAGASLVEQSISPWLLNFVASFFLSLALVKRYTEVRKKTQNEVLLGRGYNKDDEPLLLSLGIMGTGLALLSLLLYTVIAENPVIHSQVTRSLLLTILTYWLMRIWFLAHRKELNDDPVLFAVKDKISLVLGVIISIAVIIEQFN